MVRFGDMWSALGFWGDGVLACTASCSYVKERGKLKNSQQKLMCAASVMRGESGASTDLVWGVGVRAIVEGYARVVGLLISQSPYMQDSSGNQINCMLI